MRLLPETIRADYKPVRGKLQRDLITRIFQKLFREVCFEIDFQDGDIRKIGLGKSEIKVAPPSLFEIIRILKNPDFYFPQSFVEGKWFVSEGELANFVVLTTRRNGQKSRNTGASLGIAKFARHFYKQYLNVEATRETRHHYNENPKIYELVLGPSMIYSCAFFDKEEDSLEDAQRNKLETTFTRLIGDDSIEKAVLDIGCGWGGFAIFASERTPAKIDGISIASSQIEYASTSMTQIARGQQDRVTFHCQDYKTFRKTESAIYDRIVSIGMLEHVGKTQYDDYFNEIERLLSVDGLGLVHSITRTDTGITNDWIDKYVFPGGYIPRVSEVVRGIEDSSLRLENCFRHDGRNYQKTLQAWLNNLIRHERQCLEIFAEDLESKRMNPNSAFLIARKAYRIWYFYLSSIQCIFDKRGGAYDVTQFLVRKVAETDR